MTTNHALPIDDPRHSTGLAHYSDTQLRGFVRGILDDAISRGDTGAYDEADAFLADYVTDEIERRDPQLAELHRERLDIYKADADARVEAEGEPLFETLEAFLPGRDAAVADSLGRYRRRLAQWLGIA